MPPLRAHLRHPFASPHPVPCARRLPRGPCAPLVSRAVHSSSSARSASTSATRPCTPASASTAFARSASRSHSVSSVLTCLPPRTRSRRLSKHKKCCFTLPFRFPPHRHPWLALFFRPKINTAPPSFSKNACPECRAAIPTKRSLKPDEKFDELVARLFPNMGEYQTEKAKELDEVQDLSSSWSPTMFF